MYVRREGENYQQSCEERMDKADEQSIRTAMTKSYHTIKKRGLKQSPQEFACKQGQTYQAPLWEKTPRPFSEH